MARSNKKDVGFIVVRVRTANNALDRTYKAQHFDARTDARDLASLKNKQRSKLDKRYTVLPVFPGPINRKR